MDPMTYVFLQWYQSLLAHYIRISVIYCFDIIANLINGLYLSSYWKLHRDGAAEGPRRWAAVPYGPV